MRETGNRRMNCSDSESLDAPASLVVLGFGSNRPLMSGAAVGNQVPLLPPAILKAAVQRLESILSGMKVSSLYHTRAMYVTDQPDFYNMAVSGMYRGTPYELLAAVQEIEREFGRDRRSERQKGERTLDIDIELFGNTVICEKNLRIPHEFLKERQFVLVPMLEILPECAEPVTGETYRDILARLPDQGVRRA